MDKLERESFQKLANELCEASLKLVGCVTQHEKLPKEVKFELVTHMVGLMLAEAGNDLYPRFGRRELHSMFQYVEDSIREMQCEDCEKEYEEIHKEEREEKDAFKFSSLLKELAEKVEKGDSSVKCVQVKRKCKD